MENTKVSMSLINYERLKEYQKSYADLVNEIKSIYKTVNLHESAAEIIIDKQRLEKLLGTFAPDDLERDYLDHDRVLFSYE